MFTDVAALNVPFNTWRCVCVFSRPWLIEQCFVELPFEKQLQAVDGRFDESTGLRQREISARLPVERHHFITLLHSSQEGTATFLYLQMTASYYHIIPNYKYFCNTKWEHDGLDRSLSFKLLQTFGNEKANKSPKAEARLHNLLCSVELVSLV